MKKQTRHLFIKSIIICLTLAITYLITAQQLHWAPFDQSASPSTEPNNQPQATSTPSSTNKPKLSSNQQPASPAPPSKTPVQNEGPNPNQSAKITGYISNKTVNREAQVLTIRVTINQFLQQTGSCKLILTQGNQNFTTTAMTINNPSSATCQGFDVPLTKLSAGKWSMKIEIQSADKQGLIEGGEIEL